MGILNITPDSFSDGGLYASVEDALAHARAMVDAGAQIIDVGGESTAPGAQEVDPAVELERVIPVVRACVADGLCVSVDTRHAQVAAAAVAAGASIVNDVTGFTDAGMVEVAKNSQAGLVVVANAPVQGDVVDATKAYLGQAVQRLEAAGIAHDRLCVDPGPGFQKDEKQTLMLMRNIHEIARLGLPTLCAVSRKRYIGSAYGIENPVDRDQASAEEALMAAEWGATVVRAHNVEETMRALKDFRPYVYLGLGCNVALVAEPGEETEAKKAQLNLAIGQLCMIPDTEVIDIAPFYESEPAYYEKQEPFVNTVVLMRCGVAPKELLEYLHAIENGLGRVREIPNGPRTCDIDILDYQLYVVDTPELTLPHPRIQERDFVVKPFEDIRPGHVLANGQAVNVVPESERVGKAHRI